ncbi:MAG: FAD-dependent oxidoreductase [Candidatus Omnitrophica bacterium]|nr:FAD-dependent oxidoreductase [Candidatus Omnitrophota bacterium]
MSRKQFVIIGNSAAGISCVETIRKNDKNSKIIVISDEGYPAYCRCLISNYLAKEIKEKEIFYREESFYKDNQIELILNKKAVSLDTRKNVVILEDKNKFSYDYLLIATGSSPKFPSIEGMRRKGVFGFRSLKDVEEIEKLLPFANTACILGGGLIGIKSASSLLKRGIRVKLIVKSKQILSQILDFDSARIVQSFLENKGMEIFLGSDVVEIMGKDNVEGIRLDSGEKIPCSLVIVAKGVKPNTAWVKESPLKINTGILANEYLQTNIPNVFTAGDVCEVKDLISSQYTINALWPVAVEEGEVAGFNMCGERKIYPGSLGMNSVEFFGLPVISIGIFSPQEKAGYEELIHQDLARNIYKKFVLKENRLVGTILIGDIRAGGLFLRLIKEKKEVISIKDKLFNENFNYADIKGLIEEREKIYV